MIQKDKRQMTTTNGSFVTITTSDLKNALASPILAKSEKTEQINMLVKAALKRKKRQLNINLSLFPASLLSILLTQFDISEKTRDMIKGSFALTADPFDMIVGSLDELAEAMIPLTLAERPEAAVVILGHKVIGCFSGSLEQSMFEQYYKMSVAINVGKSDTHEVNVYFIERDFIDHVGRKRPMKISDLLKNKKIISAVDIDRDALNRRYEKVELLTQSTGSVVDVIDGMIIKGYWGNFEEHGFSSVTSPSRCIVEPTLESDNYLDSIVSDTSDRNKSEFVRVFSLIQKRYIFVHIESMLETVFDINAPSRLMLEPKMKKTIEKLFTIETNSVMPDIIAGKSGGMIICAAGPTGVGKTMTAEAFAEAKQRPLYSVATAELGTNVDSIERNLSLVFARAKRWNAVVLFDEADVVMMKRDSDLQRSAIVGIFLRMLDYHHGFMFMTTNRADVLDDAFFGRITLMLKYKALDSDTRAKIWSTMLEHAKIGVDDEEIVKIAKHELNGRQIRNAVRLTLALHGEKACIDDIKSSIELIATRD